MTERSEEGPFDKFSRLGIGSATVIELVFRIHGLWGRMQARETTFRAGWVRAGLWMGSDSRSQLSFHRLSSSTS